MEEKKSPIILDASKPVVEQLPPLSSFPTPHNRASNERNNHGAHGNKGNAKHMRKFDGGRRTPQEMHKQFAFPANAKCQGCGARPSVRAIVMVPLSDALAQGMLPPNCSQEYLSRFAVPIQTPSMSKPEVYVRVSMAYSCEHCRRDMEKALAKAPSWAIVEINDGPDPRNRVVFGAD